MNIQKIVLGICLCFVTPGYAQLGVIAQSKRIQVVPQPVAQVDRPGTFMLTPATPWQVENDEHAEVVKRFGNPSFHVDRTQVRHNIWTKMAKALNLFQKKPNM